MIADLTTTLNSTPRVDVDSSTWKYVDRWAEKEIEALRERNDQPELDDRKTQLLRGRISALKDLRSLWMSTKS